MQTQGDSKEYWINQRQVSKKNLGHDRKGQNNKIIFFLSNFLKMTKERTIKPSPMWASRFYEHQRCSINKIRNLFYFIEPLCHSLLFFISLGSFFFCVLISLLPVDVWFWVWYVGERITQMSGILISSPSRFVFNSFSHTCTSTLLNKNEIPFYSLAF